MIVSSTYLFVSLGYLIYFVVWTIPIVLIRRNVRVSSKTTTGDTNEIIVFDIHYWMALLLLSNFLWTLSESFERNITGLWSIIFSCVFDFMCGAFFYIFLTLMGSGWSFMKPYLTSKEKVILVCLIILQACYNISEAVLFHQKQGSHSSRNWSNMYDWDKWDKWSAVNIVMNHSCDWLVFLPAYWQLNKLMNSTNRNGERHNNAWESRDTEISDKEKRSPTMMSFFQQFALWSIFFILSNLTANFCYLLFLPVPTDDQIRWLNFSTELVSLLFLVGVGLLFHPSSLNAYLHASALEEIDNEIQRRNPSKGEKDTTTELLLQNIKELKEDNRKCREEISRLSEAFIRLTTRLPGNDQVDDSKDMAMA